ncbi:MAG: hypothetical protein M1832_000465 [Thelocarpon impressellum]|nr:MAG: hypothetical protein M1832_000465 [Thelocarpon impressellum]
MSDEDIIVHLHRRSLGHTSIYEFIRTIPHTPRSSTAISLTNSPSASCPLPSAIPPTNDAHGPDLAFHLPATHIPILRIPPPPPPSGSASGSAKMVARNLAIAIIIIVLFIVLGAVGYVIFFINQRVRLARQQVIVVDDD